MSRIGYKPIEIPDKAKIELKDGFFFAKGPNGELSVKLPDGIEAKMEDNAVTFERTSEEKKVKAAHGLARALCFNAVEGVVNGFKKLLRIEGVGFKAELKGDKLLLSLGFSHPILFLPPEGIEFAVQGNQLTVSGYDKQLVGEVAAKIRKLRPPEPYKGKGIRYEGEYVRRKEGKTAA